MYTNDKYGCHIGTFFHNLFVESNGISPLKPGGYYTYHKFNSLTFNHSTFCPHSVLMCFLGI
jgi:hypothetical protein